MPHSAGRGRGDHDRHAPVFRSVAEWRSAGLFVALRGVATLRRHCPQVPVIARARDLQSNASLTSAGAMHARPVAIGSGPRPGANALRVLRTRAVDIDRCRTSATGATGRSSETT